jgi:rhodanese-related sulfurtransferase
MDIPRIDVREIDEAMRRGEPVVFVDTRSPAAWDEATEQIPGSHRVPPDRAAEIADQLPPGALTVTYCT